MDTERENLSILMLPWLAHGHVSPFFELAKKLSLKNFHIHFCSTPINLKSIRENLNHDNIQFIDLHLPCSFHQELPPHYHTTKDLPPHLMSTLKTAFDEAKTEFCNILNTLKPNLVIYDILQPWAPEVANMMNIKAVLFLTFGGANCSFLTHWCTSPEMEFPIQEFNFPDNRIQKIIPFMLDKANGITAEERFMECMRRSFNLILIKTSREIEAKYVDYLSVLTQKEMVTVGPLVQEPTYKDGTSYIMKWLNEKDSCSVVYVSFGSEYFLSREELEEIANGLEISKVNFIWVVRFHGGEKISVQEALPEGFLKRVGERGLVIEGWAPQAKILEHSSIGGFVSHCGWSSTLEGMIFGLPIIAMPMHLDQPFNAKLVVETGVGIEVARKSDGRLDREEMAKVINEIVMGKEGKEVRRIAKELSGKLRKKGNEEMDVALERLVQFTKEIC